MYYPFNMMVDYYWMLYILTWIHTLSENINIYLNAGNI